MGSGMSGDEGNDGVLERLESGDESVEVSPSGTKDRGLEGLILLLLLSIYRAVRVEEHLQRKGGVFRKEGRERRVLAPILPHRAKDRKRSSRLLVFVVESG